MSRSISGGLLANIAKGTTSLARLFVVTRQDATVLRFTDLDRPIIFDGDTYRADITFDASAIFTSSILANAQSVTLRIMLGEGGITEDDIRQRRYDGARGDVWVIDYLDPALGVVKYYRGVFGQVVLSDKSMAEIELTPSGAALDAQAIGAEVYQPTCRNSFGDGDCAKDLDALKVTFTVTAIDGQNIEAAEFVQADEYFTQGYVTWSTGLNSGTTQQLRTSSQSAGTISVVMMPLHAIQVGDEGEVVPACDKLAETCLNRWTNFEHFRAEPNVPDGSLLQDEPISRER